MIEPLYPLDVACELIPITHDALTHILSRRASEFGPPLYHNGGEARYRNGKLVDYDGGRPLRMLRESDCLKVRDIIVRAGLARTTERPPYGGKGKSPKKHTRKSSGVWDILTKDEVENVG